MNIIEKLKQARNKYLNRKSENIKENYFRLLTNSINEIERLEISINNIEESVYKLHAFTRILDVNQAVDYPTMLQSLILPYKSFTQLMHYNEPEYEAKKQTILQEFIMWERNLQNKIKEIREHNNLPRCLQHINKEIKQASISEIFQHIDQAQSIDEIERHYRDKYIDYLHKKYSTL